MPSQLPTVSTEVKEAWAILRLGNPAQSIQHFQEIIKNAPENLDAHYGIGLAYRANGQNDKAIESFKKALSIARHLLNTLRNQIGGGESHNALETGEDDRYMMLIRMTQQRLASLGVRTE